jgi:hypothetical protein
MAKKTTTMMVPVEKLKKGDVVLDSGRIVTEILDENEIVYFRTDRNDLTTHEWEACLDRGTLVVVHRTRK